MTYSRQARAAVVFPVILFFAACTASQSETVQAGDAAAPGGLTADQRAAGWRLLVDGSNVGAWRGYKSQTMPAGWTAGNGTLTKSTVTEDIITRDKFGDFQLAFDWMISPGGNAGLFYRGTEEYDHIYWSAPEYQLLDDSGHVDGKNRLTAAGAAYGLYPAPAGILKPANQWNSTLLVVQGGRTQHWLNGQKLLEYELGGADWAAKVKASKFNDYPNYGRATSGHIGFQGDHEGTLSLRNIRIRVLP
ncbi:MAG TPA: DUF1080 domain-containing protein [Gemmatimonadaceae bacterium]|nr:DUF1080 domain-containing protein [Gemmatimonadaceae bacterium]